MPPELPRGDAGGAGAAERVEDGAAGPAAGLDAAQREIDREGGEVRAAVWTGGDRPDVAGVASGRVGGVPLADAVAAGTGNLPGVRPVLGRPDTAAAVRSPGCRPVALRCRRVRGRAGSLPRSRADGGVRDADRVEVEPVAAGSDQQEDHLVPAVETVADRLGHRVGLVPDDRVAEDPAVVLQRERDPPGQAEEVLRGHPRRPAAGEPGAEVGVQAAGVALRRPSRSRQG